MKANAGMASGNPDQSKRRRRHRDSDIGHDSFWVFCRDHHFHLTQGFALAVRDRQIKEQMAMLNIGLTSSLSFTHPSRSENSPTSSKPGRAEAQLVKSSSQRGPRTER